MAFCPKCGKELPSDATSCEDCGIVVSENASSGRSNQSQTITQDQIVDMVKEQMNTPDETAQFDQADIEANKLLCILAYLGPLVFVPIFAMPESKFARYHANQGLDLLLLMVLYAVVRVMTKLVSWIPLVGWIIDAIVFYGGLSVLLVYMVLGIVNVLNGKAKQLPLIGRFTLLK